VPETFGFDFADGPDADARDMACRVFQKRHVLAHAMGLIDAKYVEGPRTRKP
jgi:hypothetical protein